MILRSLASFCLMAAALPAAEWTNRSEYDLALAVRAEAVPKKRLDLLDQWKARFPKTPMQQVRRELYLATYQSLGNSEGMLASAREMLSDQPDNLVGLYWSALLVVASKEPSKENLELGERAAQGLLHGMDRFFASAKRPAGTSPEDWDRQRMNTALLAHRTLGWIHWQRGEFEPAADEFTAYLKLNPAAAEISWWCGMVLSLEKKEDQRVPSLWHLARASALKGEGALSERKAHQVANLVERLYVAYHGEKSGLEELRTQAVASAFPPADLKIETAAQLAERKDLEELERTNPQLAQWVKIRKSLEGPGGVQFFETLRLNPLPKFKGTLIRQSPQRRPDELILGLRDPAVPEVVLRVKPALAGEAEPGTVIEFEGSADSFSLEPFTMVILVERAKVEGWTSERR